MAKKCERCSTPALDEQSVFCNRCGAPVIEESILKVPVCSRCNSPAPNAEVLFCNRCGTEYAVAEPENHPLLCPRCGNTIADELSVFCNRCGTPVIEESILKVPVCSRCKSPAPDNEALFCNRCGTEYAVAEPENQHPHCLRCGYTIVDEQSAFCNRCGASTGKKPVKIPRSCGKCGTAALDDETLFCNRCGAPFIHPASATEPARPASHKAELPVSVRISKKRQVPAAVVPYDPWEPETDEEFTEANFLPPAAPPASSLQKKYAHLPLVADELAGGKVKNESIVITGNTKKYAHLPMIADELKEKQSPRIEIESPYYPGPPKEKKAARTKKGLFDMLKK